MGAQQQQQENEDHKIKHYPLAVKMMFNFHAESNAPTILKAMKKELLLAQNVQDDGASLLKKDEVEEISPHPNIVKIYTAFTDMVPSSKRIVSMCIPNYIFFQFLFDLGIYYYIN